MKWLLANPALGDTRIDEITVDIISRHARERREAGLQISSVNRQLQVLRRMFDLAIEWNVVEKLLPKVRLLPGETRRERVLTDEEERQYFDAARQISDGIITDYHRALEGIRATQRGEPPIEPRDPYVLHNIAIVLLDCGLRPEECFRLRREKHP